MITQPSALVLNRAEIAMGSARALMDEWTFLQRMGWGMGPADIVRLASRHPDVMRLIWC